jgi:hypothetical protein
MSHELTTLTQLCFLLALEVRILHMKAFAFVWDVTFLGVEMLLL